MPTEFSPYPINLDQLQKLDEATRLQYLQMLELLPEPDWQDSLSRLLFALKRLRNILAENENNTMIRAVTVARMLTNILTDPKIAGGAFEFLEHNKKTLDIIALEQLMTL